MYDDPCKLNAYENNPTGQIMVAFEYTGVILHKRCMACLILIIICIFLVVYNIIAICTPCSLI